MTDFDLNSLKALREHNMLEAKTAKGGFPGSFWETYSAFANTDGGVIMLGVKESSDGSLHSETGIDVSKLRKDFWNMVNNRQKISANIVTERMVSEKMYEGNPILVVNVPRAERSAKPVYVGQDPKSGTYRRNHDGDYHCSLDEMSLMFRDASAMTQDAKVLENMDSSVFCRESVKGYRNFFRSRHTNHLWNNEEDDIFLRKIGAIGIGNDGRYHPTAAGLLMFGYEYEITREFPDYFLDYQENRSIGRTRWTDRLVSTSGDWSGNVFDFVIETLRRMQQGLKVPFVLSGNQREDDTPIHKLLREAITNACVHADFYGRQGLVVQKSIDGYKISNPGSMRIPITEAIDGGISDPRNGVMLKIFSLIDFGERAGSGLNEICSVWERVYHNPVRMEESHKNGVDRTILTLSSGGNEQDVNAMLELYGNDVENHEVAPPLAKKYAPKTAKSVVKYGAKGGAEYGVESGVNGCAEGCVEYGAKNGAKNGAKKRFEYGAKSGAKASAMVGAKLTERQNSILSIIKAKPTTSLDEIAKKLGIGTTTVDREIKKLKGIVKRVGFRNGGYWEVIG